MQNKTAVVGVRRLIDMINTLGIEHRRAPLDPMNFITFFQQQLGQIRAILPCALGDQRFLHFVSACYPVMTAQN